MQCFLCKLEQMSNFDRQNSTNEHILARLFPNLKQIPKTHLAYMVGITSYSVVGWRAEGPSGFSTPRLGGVPSLFLLPIVFL